MLMLKGSRNKNKGFENIYESLYEWVVRINTTSWNPFVFRWFWYFYLIFTYGCIASHTIFTFWSIKIGDEAKFVSLKTVPFCVCVWVEVCKCECVHAHVCQFRLNCTCSSSRILPTGDGHCDKHWLYSLKDWAN